MSEYSMPSANLRTLHDDTLIVFLSDTHIGGDAGQEVFESPHELAVLLDDLAAQSGSVELVLAGDFFDFLRISSVPSGANRASLTLQRPEYHTLFLGLRRFAATENHRVIYLPGNHDAEVWWNHDIQTTLRKEGLVHEFVRSYAVCFASLPDQIIYCEHGNQFDPANTISDYDDPLDTPFGDHVVTDLLRRIVPHGRITANLSLQELNNVFPFAMIPEWITGRLFYDLLDRAFRYVLLPLLIAYATYCGLVSSLTTQQSAFVWVEQLFVRMGYDALLLVGAFSLFFVAARHGVGRLAQSMSESPPAGANGVPQADAVDPILELITTDRSPPMGGDLAGNQISLFVSGHTHAPSLQTIQRANGQVALLVNSGCWLRQLRPIRTLFRAPSVFVASYVQTHVRVFRSGFGVRVELWEHPKPVRQRLPFLERAAILMRHPPQPAADAKPVVTSASNLLPSPPTPGRDCTDDTREQGAIHYGQGMYQRSNTDEVQPYTNHAGSALGS